MRSACQDMDGWKGRVVLYGAPLNSGVSRLRTSFFERTSCRGASRVSLCRMFPVNVSTSSSSREREPLPLGYGITKLAMVSAAALPDEELRARRGHARS